MDLQTDWGNWLQGLPGRGPGIEYQILLDTRLGLLASMA
jgi:hypothetical protein